MNTRQSVVLLGLLVAWGCASKPAQAPEPSPTASPRPASVANPAAAAPEATAANKAMAMAFSPQPIYFGFDSDALADRAFDELQKLGEYLRSNSDAAVTIEGHCDDRGTTEYNLALGDRRAQTAKRYLTRLGVQPAKIRTVSYGENRPAANGDTDEAWSKNRRDEFVMGVTSSGE
jgi:peptidoglycan-associated lipoprotein